MRNLFLVIVALLVLGAIAWAAGLFNVDTSGQLKAPEVAVQGGEVPDVQVETARINIGSQEKTVKIPEVSVDSTEKTLSLPTLSIDKPGDDGSPTK